MSKRETRSCGAPMSSAIIDQERSSTSMISTRWPAFRCGRSRSASGERHDAQGHGENSQEEQQPPEAARAAAPAARAMSALGNAARRACQCARAGRHRSAATPAAPAARGIGTGGCRSLGNGLRQGEAAGLGLVNELESVGRRAERRAGTEGENLRWSHWRRNSLSAAESSGRFGCGHQWRGKTPRS